MLHDSNPNQTLQFLQHDPQQQLLLRVMKE